MARKSFSQVVTDLEKQGANADLTHRTLTLGPRDKTTGWCAKKYNEQTIKGLIQQKGASTLQLGLGFYSKYNVTGYIPGTTTIREGDELKQHLIDAAGAEQVYSYQTRTASPVTWLNKIDRYECDLEKRVIDVWPDYTLTELKANNWVKKGAIVTGKNADSYVLAEPNVIYEDGVFRMWYRSGLTGVEYSTSTDGVTWAAGTDLTLPGGTYAQPFVFKHNGTYYMYATDQAQSAVGAPFSVLTSSDGLTWTLLASNLLARTTTDYIFGNPCVYVDGDVWHMVYESKSATSSWQLHYAKSTNGTTWTRVADCVFTGANPQPQYTILGARCSPIIIKYGNIYYMWYHAANMAAYAMGGNLPTDINYAYSTDLINWVVPTNTPVLSRTTIGEGLNSPLGQVADPCICFTEDQGTWLFYASAGDQSPTASNPCYLFAAQLHDLPPYLKLPTLTGWSTVKGHLIHALPGASTHYPVKITVYYGSGVDSEDAIYMDGLCKTTFADLRFVASDGVTLLNYWIQSSTSSVSATVWVELLDDLSAGPCLFWVFAGNAAASSASSAAAIFNIPSPSVVLGYELNATTGTAAADSSGNSNTGTLVGAGATWTSNSVIGTGALQLLGTDYIQTGTSATLDPTAITIAMWVYFDSLGAGFQALCGRHGSSDARLQVNATSITIDDLPIAGSNRSLSGVYIFQAKKYYLLGLTFDGTNIRLHVNGATVATSPNYAGNLTFTAGQGWDFGALTFSGIVNPLIGAVDQIIMCNGALSASEMADLYSNSYGNRVGDVTLVAGKIYIRNYVKYGPYHSVYYPANFYTADADDHLLTAPDSDVEDSRNRTKVFLEAYLNTTNIGTAKYVIAFDGINYPLSREFIDNDIDLIITVAPSTVTPHLAYNHVAYAYTEQVPITIYTSDKSGNYSGEYLKNRVEQELRRICETYPATANLRYLQGGKLVETNVINLYAYEYILAYRRAVETAPSYPTITWGPSATPTGTFVFPNITYLDIEPITNNIRLNTIGRIGSHLQKFGAPDYTITIKANLDMEPWSGSASDTKVSWKRPQTNGTKTDTIPEQVFFDIYFNGLSAEVYQNLNLGWGATIPVTLEKPQVTHTGETHEITLTFKAYSASAASAYKTWFGIS